VPTITASPPALALAAAASDLQLARAQATAAAAPPSPEQIAAACQEVERLRNSLWQAQLERDALKIRANEGGVPWEQIGAREAGLAELERQIAVQAAACDDLRARPHAADDNALAVAAARLAQAQVDYRLAVARLTPSPSPTPPATPTASPTPTATPTRTPPPTPQTQIRSIVAGQVVAVRIVSVTGEVATVEIDVALPDAIVQASPAPTATSAVATNATVDHVVDGDTVAVRIAAPLGIFGAGAEVTVRLIGIDTPETVKPNTPVECYGREASAYMEQLLLPGQAVRLEADTDPTDKYGRLLAYVWLPDGRLINELLALGGYAQPATIAPNVRYSDRFRAAAAEARAAGRGLWSACP
jgi:micrococcal nuclease